MEKECELKPDAEPSFYSWIMILGVRSFAGLSRDDSCTSNDAESNNHVLKSSADKEETVHSGVHWPFQISCRKDVRAKFFQSIECF